MAGEGDCGKREERTGYFLIGKVVGEGQGVVRQVFEIWKFDKNRSERIVYTVVDVCGESYYDTSTTFFPIKELF